MKKTLIALAAVATVVGRVYITPRLVHIPTWEGTYEALTHLFVGFLILVPFYDRRQWAGPAKQLGTLGWALATWELVCFLAQRFVL